MDTTYLLHQQFISLFGKNAQDTGATEVQIAILSDKIQHLTSHMQMHKKDFQIGRAHV